jgi:hypothetical protein
VARQNVQDKKFVCICNFQKDAWTLGGLIDVRWTNNASVDFLLDMLGGIVGECSSHA